MRVTVKYIRRGNCWCRTTIDQSPKGYTQKCEFFTTKEEAEKGL